MGPMGRLNVQHTMYQVIVWNPQSVDAYDRDQETIADLRGSSFLPQ